MFKVYYIKHELRNVNGDAYFNLTFGDSKDEDRIELAKRAFNLDFYEHAADVEAVDLEEAYLKTQNIDQPWTENEGVVCFTDFPRSSMVGDLFFDGEKYYLTSNFGFTEGFEV